jgi:hypothetical protein
MLQGILKSVSGLKSKFIKSPVKTMTGFDTQYADPGSGPNTALQDQIKSKTSNENSQSQYYQSDEDIKAGGGGALSGMKDVLTEIAYDIKSIAINTLDTSDILRTAFEPGRDSKIAGAGVEDKEEEGKGEGGGKFDFKKLIPKPGPKVGLLLMLGALTALFKYSDQITAGVAKVLPFVTKFTDMLGPKGTLFLGLGLLAGILFPSVFKMLFGAGKGSIKLAFKLLKVGFTLMKTALMSMPGLLKSAYGGGKGFIIKAFKALKTAFTLMKVFLLEKMIPGIASAYGGVKGKLFGAISKLGTAFKAMRLFMLGTMIPAIVSFMAPFIVPLALVVGAVALAVAIFYSIKKGIDDFKKSLDEGDSMLVAIIEGVSTALLTLVTLPITLIKNFVAWVAEKLGFEGIAEKLKEFSIVDFIKDGVKTLVLKAKDFILGLFDIDFQTVLGKFVDIGKSLMVSIKAIGAGALAAAKGFLSPVENFKKGYDEYIKNNRIPEPKESLMTQDDVLEISSDAALQKNESILTQGLEASRDRLKGKAKVFGKNSEEYDEEMLRFDAIKNKLSEVEKEQRKREETGSVTTVIQDNSQNDNSQNVESIQSSGLSAYENDPSARAFSTYFSN